MGYDRRAGCEWRAGIGKTRSAPDRRLAPPVLTHSCSHGLSQAVPLLTNAQRRAGLRHLQLDGPARRSSVIQAVASVPERGETSSSTALDLISAIKLAVEDRRRVDELVTLFDYSGTIDVNGQHYAGQGAVKRFFSAFLLDGRFTDVTLLGGDEAAMAKGDLTLLFAADAGMPHASRRVNWAGAAAAIAHTRTIRLPNFLMPACAHTSGSREIMLRPTFCGGLVQSLDVREVKAPPGAQPLFSGAETTDIDENGPAWETFDGCAVVQSPLG